MKKTSVLIVDDHALIRASLTLIINSNPDYHVIGSVGNGKLAIDFLSAHPVDIILMDITMPEMNGIEATRYIINQNSSQKIMGLSMHSELSYMKEMANSGARGYLNKDCNPGELFSGIREIINGNTYFFKPFEG